MTKVVTFVERTETDIFAGDNFIATYSPNDEETLNQFIERQAKLQDSIANRGLNLGQATGVGLVAIGALITTDVAWGLVEKGHNIAAAAVAALGFAAAAASGFGLYRSGTKYDAKFRENSASLSEYLNQQPKQI